MKQEYELFKAQQLPQCLEDIKIGKQCDFNNTKYFDLVDKFNKNEISRIVVEIIHSMIYAFATISSVLFSFMALYKVIKKNKINTGQTNDSFVLKVSRFLKLQLQVGQKIRHDFQY